MNSNKTSKTERRKEYSGKIIFAANNAMALYKFRLGAMLALKNLGFEVIAIAPEDAYGEKIIKTGIHFQPVSMNTNKVNLIDDLKLFWQLLKFYRKIQPQLAFHYTIKTNIFGNLAAFLAGRIPTISIVPGRGSTFNQRNWLFYLIKSFYLFSLSITREVWFLNEEDRDFFVSEGIVKASKTTILPGEGVNTSFYLPALAPAQKRNDTTTFLLSGRLLWEKGVGEFVEAAKLVRLKYPNTQFHLLGFLDDTDHRVVPTSTVQQWVAEGTVSFMGVTDDVRPFFHRADCFVLPSYYGEGLPRTILEAASMQIPVITTNHRGCKSAVVDRENGFLCQPKCARDLAAKMLDFMQLTEKEKKEMGKKGRQLVRSIYEEKILVDFYSQKVLTLLSFLSRNVNQQPMLSKTISHLQKPAKV